MTATCDPDLDRWADDGGAVEDPEPRRRHRKARNVARERDERHAALAARVRTGDKDAADDLARDLWRLIYARANRYAFAFAPFADADDIAQAGLLRVVPAAMSYRPETGYSFVCYAMSAASRAMVSHARQEAHKRRLERQQSSDAVAGVIDFTESRRDRLPAEAVVAAEELSRLKPLHREVLARMTGYDGVTGGTRYNGSERLADEYGLSEAQVWAVFDEAAGQVRRAVLAAA